VALVRLLVRLSGLRSTKGVSETRHVAAGTPTELTGDKSMPTSNTTTTEPRRAQEQRAPSPELLDVKAVAALLDCSVRHAYRLTDAGCMPRPVRLGALVRWRKAEILAWIDDGCPRCTTYGPRAEVDR
jgi:predicted DNA-binding transcriptional regulator AlpA